MMNRGVGIVRVTKHAENEGFNVLEHFPNCEFSMREVPDLCATDYRIVSDRFPTVEEGEAPAYYDIDCEGGVRLAKIQPCEGDWLASPLGPLSSQRLAERLADDRLTLLDLLDDHMYVEARPIGDFVEVEFRVFCFVQQDKKVEATVRIGEQWRMAEVDNRLNDVIGYLRKFARDSNQSAYQRLHLEQQDESECAEDFWRLHRNRARETVSRRKTIERIATQIRARHYDWRAIREVVGRQIGFFRNIAAERAGLNGGAEGGDLL